MIVLRMKMMVLTIVIEIMMLKNNINDGICDHKDNNDDDNDNNHFQQPYSKEFFAAFE